MDSDFPRNATTSGSQDLHALYRRFLVAVMLVVLGTAPLFPRAGLAADTSNPRLAIVISNGEYSELGPLRNPVADGQLVASALRNTGFNVTYLKNLKDEQFRATLRQIARDSAKADVTLVYYAGHGAQVAGVNYLLPVDISRPEQEDDIRLASVSADEVLSVIKSPYKILILDACRDNPIVGRALSRGRSASYKSGLAPVSPPAEATGGVFIAYSTQTNAIAIDGDGANSPFAEAFAAHVGNRTSIDDMFALVTKDVLKKTNGFQRPFKYASLDTVFCLTECTGGSGLALSRTEPRPSHAYTDSVRDAFASLNSAKSVENRRPLEDRLSRQLLDALPKPVMYGTFVTPEGKSGLYGFEPDSVVADSHQVSVTVRTGELKEGKVTYDEKSHIKYSLDCDRHTMVRVESELNGAVKLFTSAEQKAEANADQLKDGAVGKSLERILCASPLRLMPLWAVDGMQWVPIGIATPPGSSSTISYAAAPSVSYQDSSKSSIRYLFIRWSGDVAGDAFGIVTRYSWVETECGSTRYRLEGIIGVTKQGAVVAFFGDELKWEETMNDGSPAKNAQVLLCDKP